MTDFKAIEFAFGDRTIQAFYYDIFASKIELFYEGYYDVSTGQYKNISCSFVIRDWKKAYSIPYDIEQKNTKRYDLDKYMYVFFIVMDIKFDSENDIFEITVNSIDQKYCTYIFEQPTMYIEEKEKY